MRIDVPIRRLVFFYSTTTSVLMALSIACGSGAGDSPTAPTPPSAPPATPTPRPSMVVATSPTFQVARTGAAVGAPPAVVVRDSAGSALNGVAVAFTVTLGGGSVAEVNTRTDATGIATAGLWKMGVAGENKLIAQVEGLAGVTFSAVATEPADGATDIRTGAVAFSGSYPAPAEMTYNSGTGPSTVTAYTGQVAVIFRKGTTESASTAFLRSNGAVVLGQIPVAGDYLVAVHPGTESAFITAVRGDPRVKHAAPNIVTAYGSMHAPPFVSLRTMSRSATAAPSIVVIDDCDGPHGAKVKATVMAAGATASCLSDGQVKPSFWNTKFQVLQAVSAATADGVIVNISSYGSSVNGQDVTRLSAQVQARERDQWGAFLVEILEKLSTFDEAQRARVVVTLAAGNNNLRAKEILDEIRSELRDHPDFGIIVRILKENVLIVGASESVMELSADAFGDPDFAYMRVAAAPTGEVGTSFAAPIAAALIHKIAQSTGLRPRDALLVAKKAVAANKNWQLLEAEAADEADRLKKYGLTYRLTVGSTGPGSITAPIGLPPGNIYRAGAQVTLTARADPIGDFTGWSGACSGNGACIVTMDADKTVTALFFKPSYQISWQVMGGPGGVSLNPDSATYSRGREVLASAIPGANRKWAKWTGDCAGQPQQCRLVMNTSKVITAYFDSITAGSFTLSLGATGTGTGTIVTDPAGSAFAAGTTVKVSAVASQGSTFQGWSGACSGMTACSVLMNANKAVTATFTRTITSFTYTGAHTGTMSNPPLDECTYPPLVITGADKWTIHVVGDSGTADVGGTVAYTQAAGSSSNPNVSCPGHSSPPTPYEATWRGLASNFIREQVLILPVDGGSITLAVTGTLGDPRITMNSSGKIDDVTFQMMFVWTRQ